MGDSLVQIYLHFVWGTWNRLPLINDSNEQQVYSAIIAKCNELKSSVLALGGISEHVHLLVRFPSTIPVAEFIKKIKGSTSHLLTHHLNSEDFFKWQGSYAVFSVGDRDVQKIKSYILNQKEHHMSNDVNSELEL